MLVELRDEHNRVLIHQLRTHAEQWLAAKGLDQYRGPRSHLVHPDIDRLFDKGAFVGWVIDGDVKAVLAIDEHDPDFWTREEMAEPGVTYITRFMAREHGHGYGASLLRALAEREASRGQRYIRLDCWRTNTRLHEYYRTQGFRHVRTEIVEGRMSGALFEKALSIDSSPTGRGADARP
ncbi:GNAT family N-acetyltransferase [Thermasporomyces composti]|jgi:ribosomal protein S18 acetylase RimI-like enzyme|uniref:Acetyltransferase (GNAT) family protein n=1 Tax=Thermasporomyces composti TaxID=696763 RepID=A0A3D9VK36_THECX|nr:GNAT family N-acetyltransferase [Thermasporomyces composti]REF37721.1 acetyltransferase (GNAT) family protein [Thermasporomyces composti]